MAGIFQRTQIMLSCTSKKPVFALVKNQISHSTESQKRKIPSNRVLFQLIRFTAIKTPRRASTGEKIHIAHSQKADISSGERYEPTTEPASEKNPIRPKKSSTRPAITFFLSELIGAKDFFLFFRTMKYSRLAGEWISE